MSQISEEQQVGLKYEQEKEKFILVMPEMKHRTAAVEYITEFIESEDDIDGLGINFGPRKDIVKDYDAYGEWLYWLYGEGKSGEAGTGGYSDKPESFTYFFIEEQTGKLIGTVNLRTDGELAEMFGNLGYAIRPSFRGKGYGTMMVESALAMCGFMGMERVTAVCHGKNHAGIRLLEKCGFCRTGFLGRTASVVVKSEIEEYFGDFKSDVWFERKI